MRTIANGLVALVLGGIVASCGGPPKLLTGHLRGAWGCAVDPNNPNNCQGERWDHLGTNNEGTPPHNVGCSMLRLASGATRINFRVARGGQSLEESQGVAGCFEATTGDQMVTTGSLDLYVRGSNSTNQSLTGTCRARMTSLEMNGFGAQIACNNALDTNSPPRRLVLSGVAGSAVAGGTVDPAWADLAVENCLVVQSLAACQ